MRIACLVRNWIMFACLLLLAGSREASAAQATAPPPGCPPAAEHDRRIELREIWRTGDDDSEAFFGLAIQAMATDSGGVAVLDHQRAMIFLFSRDGRLTGEIDLSGAGPGSVAAPVKMIRLVDGRIALAQMFPAKIEILDMDWQYERTVNLFADALSRHAFGFLYDIVEYGEGFLVVAETVQELPLQSSYVRRRINVVTTLSFEGVMGEPLYSRTRENDWLAYRYVEDEEYLITFRQIAARPAGDVFLVTSRNGYEVKVFGRDGREHPILTRDYQAVARTEQEIRFHAADFLAQAAHSRNPEIVVSSTEPDIESLDYTAAGELRVTTSRSYRSDEPEVFCRYDVFDADGRFLRHDDVILVGEDRSGRLFWLDDGRVVLITGLIDALIDFQASLRKVVARPRAMYDRPMEMIVFEVVGWGGEREAP